jgi:hypothetical protein
MKKRVRLFTLVQATSWLLQRSKSAPSRLKKLVDQITNDEILSTNPAAPSPSMTKICMATSGKLMQLSPYLARHFSVVIKSKANASPL